MNIAVQCADLDAKRIDGTRVYIKELLQRFGVFDTTDRFLLYHRAQFNSALTPPHFDNYDAQVLLPFPFWTQTRFAQKIFRTHPDVVWMPMHALPFTLPKNVRTVVTIHDLAFKIFPSHFSFRDRIAQNILTDSAVDRADALIAVSESTRRDIIRFYPHINYDKIHVIHHGFDGALFTQIFAQNVIDDILHKYHIKSEEYILYVGALQPRKNLIHLIRAFEILAQKDMQIKLVLAGEKAWLYDDILTVANNSPVRNRIVLTGRVSFDEVAVLMQNARVFAFPSLYEGFGLPILEAFASGVPVITARNSSLEEVGGDAVVYISGDDVKDFAQKMETLINDDILHKKLITRGKQRLSQFSWDKCAKQTLEVLTKLGK